MKEKIPYPVIDVEATGRNIERLRKRRDLTVRDLQEFFAFSSPGAIYQWQRGDCLPSVDNLYALSAILRVSMNDILVPRRTGPDVWSQFPWGMPPAVSAQDLFCVQQFLAA